MHCIQTSSQLHKTVVDYDYFKFMKEDYGYTITFACEITITLLIIHFLNSKIQLRIFCLIMIIELLDYVYNLIVQNSFSTE